MQVINFANQRSGNIYARMEEGKWVWWDEETAAQALSDPFTMAGLSAIGWNERAGHSPNSSAPENLKEEMRYTLGAWASELD